MSPLLDCDRGEPKINVPGGMVATSGNVTDEVIAKYIEEQDVEPQDDDFKVTD
jgi:hypothetical protein